MAQFLYMVLGLLAAADPANAAAAQARPPKTVRTGDWRVELLTMGPGREAYSRFGHSALRVRDLRGETDLVFNFGTFDDEAPDAVRRFLEGRLKYWLSVETFEETRADYRREGRRLVAQELVLSGAQRYALFRRLRHLARPENRAYRYHHYDANCSTRIRDELDRALGGLLRRRLKGRPAATPRHWLRRATRGAPAFHLGFDLVLTRSDRPIDAWQACFAPEQLMMGVARLRRDGASGAPAGPLVARTRELLPGPGFGSEGGLAPWLLVVLGAVLLSLWIALPPVLSRRSTLAWRISGAGLVVSGLAQTALGAVIACLWMMSRLEVFRMNQSLLLVPPTALAWVATGVWVILRPPSARVLPRWMLWVGVSHLGIIGLYGVGRLLEAHPQGNQELLLCSLVLASASLAILRLGRTVAKSSE